MKILLINAVCGVTSTGRICTDLAEKYAAEGHDVKIAYGREPVPQQYRKYAVRIGTDMGVRINGIKTRLLDTHGLNARKATEVFLKWA